MTRNEKKRNLTPVIAIAVIILAILAIGGFLAYQLIFNNYTQDEQTALPPNMEEIDFFDFAGNSHLDAHRINVVIGGEIITGTLPPVFISNSLYLPADLLRLHVDNHIFWESAARRLTITCIDEVLRFTPGSNTYTLNWEERPLANPIREVGGMAYISAEMIMQRYPVTILYNMEYSFVIMDFSRYQMLYYNSVIPQGVDDEDAQDWIAMRFGPSDQYPIMARLALDANVLFINAHYDYDYYIGIQYSGFYRVRLENGLIGYVAAENLEYSHQIAAIPDAPRIRPQTRTFDQPINFLYHQDGINNPDSWYAPRGVNVISPYWFSFFDSDPDNINGDIRSLARHDYVQWAHANGLEVWPIITDNFSNIVARAVLLDPYVRDHVIAQIMQLITTFNLDGINIDYERVLAPEAEHWIQFLRELAVPMRQAGAILSVAIFPPIPNYNMFWNRYEIGRTSDFVVIMAYDEHWRTSPIAGPVSSYNYVLTAVRRTLTEVPAYRTIVALPTYVNIWREELIDGEWRLPPGFSARQVGMAFARQIVNDLGGEFIWEYIVRQYLAEVIVEVDGQEIRYRVWLECLRSMNEKLSVFGRYNLAGVGFWVKGLELPAMWDLVQEHLHP